jgi:hypothetical protein
MYGAVDIAVVGNGHGLLAYAIDVFDQLVNIAGAIQ